jgi:retinol dehydrogenase-12
VLLGVCLIGTLADHAQSARLHASRIVLACRDVKKGKAAVEKIRDETKCGKDTKLEVWDLDLSSYDSVVGFGKRVCTELHRLDAFIANAGMEAQTFQVAEDIEKHLTVNVVSCFLSAIACLPLLRETSNDFDTHTTLTFCGSMYHIFGPDNEFDAGLSEDSDMFDVLSDPTRTDVVWRYALSKLMVHQCFHELVAHVDQDLKHADSRLIINIVNPGWCGTELSRAKPSNLGEKFCFALMGWTAEKGSRIYLHALAAGRRSHGQYLSEDSSKVESQYVRSDRGRQIQAKMWRDLVNRMVKVAPEVAGLVS